MVVLPYTNHPTRTNPGISNDPTLRIQVCPTKGIIYTDPFLFFSDGIGTQKFQFDRERIGFLGHIPNTQCMRPYIQYIYSYVHLPRKLAKRRNMYIKSKVFCFQKKKASHLQLLQFLHLTPDFGGTLFEHLTRSGGGPRKLNGWKPENTPLEKENHLKKKTSIFRFHVNLPDATCMAYSPTKLGSFGGKCS